MVAKIARKYSDIKSKKLARAMTLADKANTVQKLLSEIGDEMRENGSEGAEEAFEAWVLAMRVMSYASSFSTAVALGKSGPDINAYQRVIEGAAQEKRARN